MQHYKAYLIWCCYGVQLAATAVALWLSYYWQSPDDARAKARMKRIILIVCFFLLISGIGVVIIRGGFWAC
jgi:hypothetical protein